MSLRGLLCHLKEAAAGECIELRCVYASSSSGLSVIHSRLYGIIMYFYLSHTSTTLYMYLHQKYTISSKANVMTTRAAMYKALKSSVEKSSSCENMIMAISWDVARAEAENMLI